MTLIVAVCDNRRRDHQLWVMPSHPFCRQSLHMNEPVNVVTHRHASVGNTDAGLQTGERSEDGHTGHHKAEQPKKQDGTAA
jgi:hypothetical protein